MPAFVAFFYGRGLFLISKACLIESKKDRAFTLLLIDFLRLLFPLHFIMVNILYFFE